MDKAMVLPAERRKRVLIVMFIPKELARFCRRMGRETDQGEIGLVIADEYLAITNFDEEL